MKVRDLVKLTTSKLNEFKNEEDREQMTQYMKGHFDYLGVKSPVRIQIQKEINTHWKSLDDPSFFEYVELLWEEPYRELQYVGVKALESRRKKWNESYLPRVEKLLVSKSWWDTVDALAANIAGTIFYKDPYLRLLWVHKWNDSDNLWLNRSAIIHQLRYKEDVNLEILFELVESHQGSTEFFINKASGWALRQASKFYPQEVKDFISDHPNLSNLTKKEGSKYLN